MKENIKNNPLEQPDDFKAFFHDFFPVITIFAKRYVIDEDIAQDIAQEAFIAAWKKKPDVKSDEDLRFYLYTVVKNKCLNYLKHQKTKKTYIESFNKDDEGHIFDATMIENEVFIQLSKAIKSLAPKTQEILNLSLQGHGNNEIAENLNISVNTIKTLKRRAFKKLNQQLKDHFYLFFL